MNRGDKISTDIVVEKCITRKSWSDSKYLYLLSDDSGNVFTITSKSKTFAVGEHWLIEGKVKKQNVFCGRRQNHVADWRMTLCKKD
jgi:hypothetical protein